MNSGSPDISGRTASATEAHDLTAYRGSIREQARVADLLDLIPARGGSALDVGARDGFVSILLTRRFEKVTALDLSRPNIEHPAVECVQGDVCRLAFPDSAFDLVLCAEVLEHLPADKLRRACAELARVTRRHLVIGVPFEQDIRLGRTLCGACGRRNPPWGHVNAFDEGKLELLFPALKMERVRFVGKARERTSAIAAWLDDRAGNPYGTYGQEESCVHCGARLSPPLPSRALAPRLCAAGAHWMNRVQRALTRPRPIWIHQLYSKPA